MLFEIHDRVPDVSENLIPVREAFLNHRTRESWKLANEIRKTPDALQCPNDFILCIEVARAAAAHRTYLALCRIAISRYPNDPYAQLYHARALLTRRRHTEALDYLHSIEHQLGITHYALWATALANTYADCGFSKSCNRWLEKAKTAEGYDSPLGLYTRACAMEGLQQWDEAIDLCRQCVAKAPGWARARTILIHLLLTRSNVDEALSQVNDAKARGEQDASLDMSGAMLEFSLGNFETAKQRFEAILNDWPQTEHRDWVRRSLAILLVEMGQHQAAIELIGDDGKRLALPQIPDRPSGASHQFISLPLLAQNKDQCVPTTIAMAAYPQGKSLDPDQLFREMKGREGTAIWRAWDWVTEHGFQAVPIQLSKAAAIRMVDRGIPLIGTIHGAFHSHVEVIMGYNEDLDVAYVRDPANWAPMAWPWEMLLPRYELQNGLLAVIDGTASETIELARSLVSDDYQAIVDLCRAVANGKVEEAEQHHEKISDPSPANYLRDSHGVHVTISPKRFQDRQQEWAGDEDVNPIVRFRALMNLGSDDAKKMLEDLEKRKDGKNIGGGMKRFLRLITLMNDGDWKEADRIVDRLLVRGCGVSVFWEIKSDVQSELGDATASREALEKAIELEPLRMNLREKQLARNIHTMTFSEYLDEFDQLLSSDPDDKHLLRGRAMALLDGPGGLAFEEAANETLRWFPRDPRPYVQLMQWYETQGRKDLSDQTLVRAKRWLPDIFEVEDEPDGDDKTASDKKSSDGTSSDEQSATPESPKGLPSEKSELLSLIWQLDDERRDQAVLELVRLQNENRLQWFECAKLVACRLLVPEKNAHGEPAVTPQQCLPNQVPGAPHWFVGTVADTLTDFGCSIPVAKAVIDWTTKISPDYQAYPDLWFQMVLLLEQAKEKESALSELEQITTRYPAYSSALYRMGVVKLQQGDYSSSLQFADRALSVNPGLYGGLQLKRRVVEVLGHQAAVDEVLDKLIEKLPYDFDTFQDSISRTIDSQPIDQTLQRLKKDGKRYPKDRVLVLTANALHRSGDREAAVETLGRISANDEDEIVAEDKMQLQMAIALEDNNTDEVLRICERGLKLWPDSTRLKEIKSQHIADRSPEQAAELLRETIMDGEPTARTIYQYLGLSTMQPDLAGIELVNSSTGEGTESKQEEIAELCDDVFTHPSLMVFRQNFLDAMMKKFPESNSFRWKLASHLHMTGNIKRAVKVARDLHQRVPEEPEARRMLGRILIDRNPKEAVDHLEEACRKDRSVDYLFDLARCYQLVGRLPDSKKLHWEILDQNPYAAASWTNLFILNSDKTKLWKLLPTIIESGNGTEDEYFLVAAVKLAIQMRDRLPSSWYSLAVTRNQMLKTHTGFQNERVELSRALQAWLAKRPMDRSADLAGTEELPASGISALYARFVWPKKSWIPDN